MSVTRKNFEKYKGFNWEEELKKHKEFKKGIDDRFIGHLQSIRTKWLDRTMIMITRTGDGGTIWIILALYIYIFKKLHSQAIVMLCVLATVAVVANIGIKNLFTKDRPCDIDESVTLLIRRPLGSSTPSGHSASSFAAVVVLFFINPLWGAIAAVWASLIAFSRIYLYVHYPSDVLFGIITGVVIALAVMPVAVHFIGW